LRGVEEQTWGDQRAGGDSTAPMSSRSVAAIKAPAPRERLALET
jgi:hypothetical protein